MNVIKKKTVYLFLFILKKYLHFWKMRMKFVYFTFFNKKIIFYKLKEIVFTKLSGYFYTNIWSSLTKNKKIYKDVNMYFSSILRRPVIQLFNLTV